LAGIVHAPFEARARDRPDAPAVRCRDASLSYGELDRRANVLAHTLQRAGVGPDVLVGHFIERSVDAVVALVAILKAGGAYLPLDPDNPPARTQFVLEDARPRVVLTQSSLRARVPGECLLVDEFDFEGDGRAPHCAATADNLAYVIYTSGSTGQPKGTLVTHRNVDRLFTCTQPLFGFTASDVWSVFHSFAFDFSVWELWGALRYGGCAVVVPGDVARATAAFRSLVDDERVTVLCQTPSAFNALVDVERIAPLRAKALRYVIFGGEALEFRRLAPWYARHGDAVQLVNMYGITETTVHTTYFPIRGDALAEGSVIGVPLPDLRIHLLDANGAPVARGGVGEIHVEGPGVALGYLGRPELTAARFVRNPQGNGTWYRSGDLGRMREDGNLEFCGRIDDQVKLRGYRIELGEIESALDRCHGVTRSAVTLRATGHGDKELVAYVLAAEDARITPGALRDALAPTLPAYMVPSAFVAMAAFPLTGNGKLDKAALPAPRREHRPVTSGDAPRGDTECRVAAIWAKALAAERVGRLDDFFALGAHSLMMAAVCVRLEDEFDEPLRAIDVYAARNVARLAEAIDWRRARSMRPSEPGPAPRTGDPALPAAFGQDVALFFHELAPGNLAYNNQVVVRLSGALDVALLERALAEIVRRHESLRTTFERVDGNWQQVIQPPWRVEVPVVDGGHDYVRALFDHRFDPHRLPLVRWTLVRHSPSQHTLVHVEHHLVHDGWSFGVFARELTALYEAFARGDVSPLPALPVQFADFVLWQRARDIAPPLAYWKRTLAGTTGVLDLPTDRPRPKLPTFAGDEVQIDLSPALSNALREYAKQYRASLFAVMVAGFAAVLSRRAGQDDIVVGSGFANREHRLLAPLIGMIVNMVPLRLRVGADATFARIVEMANDAARDAMAHQQVPFDAIVREVGVAHDASRNPLCQVAFSFHDSAMPPWRMGGVTGEVDYPHNGSAKFDMNVIVVPHAEQQAGLPSRDARITLKWDFNTALFDRATVERMVQGYLALLEAGTAQPQLAVAALLDADALGAAAGFRTVRSAPAAISAAIKEMPRTATEHMVAEVWSRHFDCEGVGIHDDFFDSGGHSLAAASVFAELSARTGADLPLSLLFEARTIASLAQAIDERRTEARSPLLLPVQRAGRKPPIFAMLGIGGNFVGYAALTEAFGDDQPFYSLEMPGLDGDALPDERIEDIVVRLRSEMRDIPGSERCVLIGACAGALVVYELARALAEDGREVAHVIMLDPPPTGEREARGVAATALRRRLALPRFVVSRMTLAMRKFRHLKGEERLRFLRAKAQVLRDIVERRDLLRESRQELHYSRVREATTEAITHFAPGTYAGRVTLLVGDRYSLDGAQDVSSNWRTRCRGSFAVARVPGNDTGAMFKPPHLAQVTERLRALL
jgi:amino acid adenylation domain-containing protein